MSHPLPTHPAVIATVAALEKTTVGQANEPLFPNAYLFIFPVLSAVLKWPSHTPLHEAALRVAALHVDPDRDVPRPASLDMLYTMLSVLPAFRYADPSSNLLCAWGLPKQALTLPLGFFCSYNVKAATQH